MFRIIAWTFCYRPTSLLAFGFKTGRGCRLMLCLYYAIRRYSLYKELQCVSISVGYLCRLNYTLFPLHDVSSTCRFQCRVIRRFHYSPFPVFMCYTPFPLPAHSAFPRKIRNFQPISRRISETLQDRTKVTINH